MARRFRGAADLAALNAFLAQQWRQRGVRNTFHSGDLHWRLRRQSGVDPRRDIQLWYGDDGRVMGFAWFDPRDASGDTVGEPADELLEWMESRARGARSTALGVGCFEDDAPRAAMLHARGYRKGETTIDHFFLSLAAAPPTPKLPAGFRIRDGCERDGWLEPRVDVHQRAWRSHKLSLEGYRDVLASPAYRPEFDVAVENERGVLVACLNAWLDPVTRVGLFEPVGSDPAYRRRGLVRAAIHHTLARLREAGAEAAVVCSVSGNASAQAVYASSGFQRLCRDYDWQLTLKGGRIGRC